MTVVCFLFFQAEDGIRDLVRSRGLGDVYKRQDHWAAAAGMGRDADCPGRPLVVEPTPGLDADYALSLIHI